MTEFKTALNSAHEFIFDDNVHKLYANRNNNDVIEFMLLRKETGEVIEKGIINFDELLDVSKDYVMCYLDGYAFDIVADCYL